MEAKIQSLKDYLLKEETWGQLGLIFIEIVLILLVSAVAVRVGKRIIQKFF